MDRAEAIKVLQSKLHLDCSVDMAIKELEAREVAIAALREQEQREQGCEWCFHFESDPQHLIGEGNGMYTELIYNFCPMCGRKLGGAKCGDS